MVLREDVHGILGDCAGVLSPAGIYHGQVSALLKSWTETRLLRTCIQQLAEELAPDMSKSSPPALTSWLVRLVEVWVRHGFPARTVVERRFAALQLVLMSWLLPPGAKGARKDRVCWRAVAAVSAARLYCRMWHHGDCRRFRSLARLLPAEVQECFLEKRADGTYAERARWTWRWFGDLRCALQDKEKSVVYGMLHCAGNELYIGKADCCRKSVANRRARGPILRACRRGLARQWRAGLAIPTLEEAAGRMRPLGAPGASVLLRDLSA